MKKRNEVVRVGDASLWTVRQGQGVPLVLCHGGPGMFDYLGPVADLVDDLAMAYCLEHPERARGLLYVSGTGVDPGWHATYRASRSARLGPEGLRRFTALREQIARSEGGEKATAESAYRVLDASTDLADPHNATQIVDTVWTAGLQVNDEVNRFLGADATRIVEDEAIRSRIAGLRTPTLIVHGEADPRPLGSVRLLAELLPHARFVSIPACGHYPWLEQPEVFRAILRDFLSDASASSGKRG